MFKGEVYERLLQEICSYPVIDCHEHINAPDRQKRPGEAISYFLTGYVASDLHSSGASAKTMDFLGDAGKSTAEKWPVYSDLWRRCQHTAYARVVTMVLEKYFDVREMSLEGLEQVNKKLKEITPDFSLKVLDDAGIKILLADLFWGGEVSGFLNGKLSFPPKWKLMFPLPAFHGFTSAAWLGEIGRIVDRNITSLDDYLEAVYQLIKTGKEQGMVGIKDQSAYNRTLEYDVTAYADAERLFNRIVNDQRNSLGWPERKPLDDFLFHRFMRFAASLNMPVQLHTGHMAGVYNRVDKANARGLVSTLELHKDVRFDLFHGNWPYMDDLLFLVKNYPNAYLDCCWLHIIDPIYAEELLMRAVMTLPHSKILGFGGDYAFPEFSAMHAEIGRRVIASALSKMVSEKRWINEDQAARIAADWLYNNAVELFDLDLV